MSGDIFYHYCSLSSFLSIARKLGENETLEALPRFYRAENPGFQYGASQRRAAFEGTGFMLDDKGNNLPMLDCPARKDGGEKAKSLMCQLGEWVENRPKRQIALLLALAAPLCELLRGNKHEGSIALGLVGKSSTGKSSIAAMAANIFANADDVTWKFNSTMLALLENLNGNAGIPVVFDDTRSKRGQCAVRRMRQAHGGVWQ